MSKTKIDYLDYQWNYVVGCNYKCRWCWARNRIAPRLAHLCKDCGDFIPHIHPKRMNDPYRIKKPSVIGVSFFGDLWDKDVKGRWRQTIFSIIDGNPEHKFIVLTKQPQNIREEDFRDYKLNNLWVGVSITGYKDLDRWWELNKKKFIRHKLISFEPLLQNIDIPDCFAYRGNRLPEWVIIGALTGMGKENALSREVCRKEYRLVKKWGRKYRIPFYFKENCGIKSAMREFPEGFPKEMKK